VSDPRLLLRLSEVPGLDPVGLPALPEDTDGGGPGALLCPDPDYPGDWLAGPTAPDGWEDSPGTDCAYMTLRVESPRLSLADAATRDRCARWLAERVGLEVGATAPGWYRIGTSQAWALQTISAPRDMCCIQFAPGPVSLAALGAVRRRTHDGWGYGSIVAIASIDPADPQADWLALAAVCRHVGGER
jgi:hypothetical protein